MSLQKLSIPSIIRLWRIITVIIRTLPRTMRTSIHTIRHGNPFAKTTMYTIFLSARRLVESPTAVRGLALPYGNRSPGTTRTNDGYAHNVGPMIFTILAKLTTTTQPMFYVGRYFRLAPHIRVETIPANLIIPTQHFTVDYF